MLKKSKSKSKSKYTLSNGENYLDFFAANERKYIYLKMKRNKTNIVNYKNITITKDN